MPDSAPFPVVRYWHDLTTREVVREAGDAVVIWPLAAVEQHGPHLPLSTDVEVGTGILGAAFRALPSDARAFALPVQAVGTSLEHAEHPGTLTVSARVLEDIVYDVGSSLARSGVRRLVLFNSHGGNRATLDTAGLRLRRAHGLLVVKASYFRFPRPDDVDLPDSEWEHGLHGGAVETSMMLHLRPDLVRSEEVQRFPSLGEELEQRLTHLRPEGAASFAWTARDLNLEGVVGDAAAASASVGARLIEHYGRCLAEVVQDARAFPLSRLARSEP
jgi:creatinine amidohydrolase